MKKQKELIIINKIYITSDLHFCHDRTFIWEARGYKNVEEMNKEQIRKWNEIIDDQDEVWVLGDLMLGNLEEGIACLKQLKGKIHACLGNHCTSTREVAYKELGWDVHVAARLKYKKINFYLSHFPTICANLESESLYQTTVNLFGHTHQTVNFYQDNPYMYHVGVDSHNGYPISLDQVIEDIKIEMNKCKEMLYNEGDKEND